MTEAKIHAARVGVNIATSGLWRSKLDVNRTQDRRIRTSGKIDVLYTGTEHGYGIA